MTIHVVLADNQAIFRAGAARVLAMEEGVRIVAQCDTTERLLQIAETTRGCVLLVARTLVPDLEALSKLTKAAGSRVVYLTERAEELSEAEYALLDGLLSRHTKSATLVDCVRHVARGERRLSPVRATAASNDPVGVRVLERLTSRELQIVGHIVRGCKNREIAEELGTKEQVVKNYLRAIYDKTGVSDRLELALFTLHHRTLAEAAARATDASRCLQPA